MLKPGDSCSILIRLVLIGDPRTLCAGGSACVGDELEDGMGASGSDQEGGGIGGSLIIACSGWRNVSTDSESSRLPARRALLANGG